MVERYERKRRGDETDLKQTVCDAILVLVWDKMEFKYPIFVPVSKMDELSVDDFRSQLELSPVKKGNMQLPGVGTLTLEEVEVEMIKRAMDHHKNKISRAAAALGLTRSALYRRLDKYQIPYDEAED